MSKANLKFFSGSSHPELAKAVVKKLKVPLSDMELSRFASGELFAKPLVSVRGSNVFVLQTCTANLNEELMELFIMLDSLKRSFAKQVHVIIPYYGYARQDRVNSPREPITARLVADLISAAGADHVITINLHSGQQQGFFNFPVDNILPQKLFSDYFKKKNLKDVVVVSPDVGGAKEAKKMADALGADIAIIHKTRPRANVAEVIGVTGEVEGKTCIIFDDMIDTGGSVVNAREALLSHGAKKQVYLAATHAVFSPPAVERLKKAKFAEVVVTDTIPLGEKMFPGLKVLSVADVVARTVESVHEARSVSGIWH